MERSTFEISPLRRVRKSLPTLFGGFPMLTDDFLGESFNEIETQNVSISEDDTHYFVEANVPGLAEEDIELSLNEGVLWIKGEKNEEVENKKRKYYSKTTRSYSYRIAVPGDIDESVEPEATYKDGVIAISFPKAKKAEPKKISVKRK